MPTDYWKLLVILLHYQADLFHKTASKMANTVSVAYVSEHVRAAGLQASQHSANGFCRQLMTLALSCLIILTNQLRTANNQEASTVPHKWLLCTKRPLGHLKPCTFNNIKIIMHLFLTSWVVGCWCGSVCSEVQTCIWPSGFHCHSLSLASEKSRLLLPFWYRLTWVVPEKRPLNGCVCVLYLTS